MRILFLSQLFYPESTFKGLPFAKELIAHGHEVEVLTGFPNYPGGKLYPGYKIRFFQRDIVEGIRINRVPIFPSHDGSGILRIFNYLSLCFSAMFIGPFVIRKHDVIYVYNLPTLGFAANIIRFFYKSKIVLDLQDLWPETVIQSNMLNNRTIHKVLRVITNAVYSSADHVAVLSPGFKKELISRGIEEKKITVIQNWSNEAVSPFEGAAIEALKGFYENGYFNVVFAGTMGKMQALESVIDAASIIEKLNPQIHFWFIGGGVEFENLKDTGARKKTMNIHFIPWISRREIGAILNKSDLLLVHLKKIKLFEITIPSKIQAYLFVGRPILVAVQGDATHLVETAKAGLSCEPENPKSIVDAVLKFYDMSKEVRDQMGENGRRYYEKELSMKTGVDKFHNLFLNQLSRKSELVRSVE